MVHTNKHTHSCVNICLAFMMILLFISACKKFVEVDPPVNSIVSSVIFTSDSMATSAVTGVYSEMMSTNSKFSSCELTLYAGLSADELISFPSSNRDEFLRNQITIANHTTLLSIFWDKAYKFIYVANLCIEGLDQSTGLTPSLKKRLTGECKFIRAFCYFNLINLFGDVPLTTVSDYRYNAILPRASVSAVYDQIIADLIDSKKLLSVEYPTAGKVRPNKWTSTSLLARVWLYRNEWAKAEVEADSVINSGSYRLEDSLKSVFLKSSAEAIWQLLPVNTNSNNTWEGNVIIPPVSNSSFYLTDTLLRSFEGGDRRRAVWVASNIISPTQTRYYPFKYKVKSDPNKIEYYMVFRLAEQILIRAEAKAKQNKLAEAKTDIDAIRTRAGLPNIIANSQANIISAIEHERQIELFAEWGHRWYDLKRTNRANEVLGGQKSMWTSNDILWPIPNSQILVNPALTQNPGY